MGAPGGPQVKPGWAELTGWRSVERYKGGEGALVGVVQVAQVQMVHDMRDYPELTCVVLTDMTVLYVAMPLADVLRVLGVLP
jgi:hypothetical protein